MIPTRPAGGEHVLVQAVRPAVIAPSADPRLAADAVLIAAALRAADRDPIAPRVHRAIAHRLLVAIPIVARAATAQPGVLAQLALRTEQAPTKAAVAARVVQGHGVAIALAPQSGAAAAVLQHHQTKPAVPSAPPSVTANPAMPASADPVVHRVVVPARAVADAPSAMKLVARAAPPAQAVMHAIHDAAPAKVLSNVAPARGLRDARPGRPCGDRRRVDAGRGRIRRGKRARLARVTAVHVRGGRKSVRLVARSAKVRTVLGRLDVADRKSLGSRPTAISKQRPRA